METRQELESAINEKTGMMFFLNKAEPDGQIKSDEFIQDRQKARCAHYE